MLVGCLTSQQHASVPQGRICTDNFKCCHTEVEVADQTFYLTQSQYTDTGPTSPSADLIAPGTWQGSHWRGERGGIPDLLLSRGFVCWLVACFLSRQHASVSQGRMCSDNCTCCYAEIEVADQTFYLTLSQYAGTGSTSPSADPITSGAWQGCHWNVTF